MPINLPPAWLEIVRKILNEHVPEYVVWAFGSRVTGQDKTHSDLDLVIRTDQPLSLKQMALLCDAFSESDLPIRVDIVDWSTLEPNFQRIILKSYEQVS